MHDENNQSNKTKVHKKQKPATTTQRSSDNSTKRKEAEIKIIRYTSSGLKPQQGAKQLASIIISHHHDGVGVGVPLELPGVLSDLDCQSIPFGLSILK